MSATFRATGATLLHASNSPLTRLTAAPSQRASATLFVAPKPAPLPNLAPSKAELATLTERITPIAKSAATPTLFAGTFAGTGAVGGSSSDDTSLEAAPPAAPLQAPTAPSSSSKMKWIVGGIAVTGVVAAGIAIALAATSKKKKKRR